ncbi:transcriptional regulator [Desulfurococcus amylolyticus]|uniref:Transcriptional regulator, LuxR family n=1 Tax=Desulfurococcus amylolyticus DSM 16532 TaxID=768672 RepID=I3XQ25_DESAM|nr:transcriptional regulator [Desulfurococcus amylolyticus]AFL66049.1 transcriptional regulator, LuxR family [Desulfurococcus amylolyticus DSM 16532]
MSEINPTGEATNIGTSGSGDVLIDLSNIPLKPLGKREISQLEMALIIGTLYRPEILELIHDPVERSTWVDSLAVAAGAYARMKAGLPVSQIAEELGRSETTIRSHLNMKTKAGKLIHETYEKLKKGELKLLIPFIKAPAAGFEDQIKVLKEELEKQREKNRQLETRVNELTELLKHRENEVQALKEEVNRLQNELEAKSKELNTCIDNNRLLKERIDGFMKNLYKVLEELQNTINTG